MLSTKTGALILISMLNLTAVIAAPTPVGTKTMPLLGKFGDKKISFRFRRSLKKIEKPAPSKTADAKIEK